MLLVQLIRDGLQIVGLTVILFVLGAAGLQAVCAVRKALRASLLRIRKGGTR